MVNQDPEAHDTLYVELWGVKYREHPEFRAWVALVKGNPSRSLRSFKNDLTDRLSESTSATKRKPIGWGS